MKLKWKNPAAPGPQVRENNGVIWLSYPMLEQCPGVRNAFSTREGGVSQGIWSTMNLSYTRGDDPEHVTENYRRFAAAAGFRTEDIVSSDQTHTTNVRHVTEKDRGSGITREREFHDTDGLITDTPGVVLATYYADCVPLYFVDPVHRAIGLSHSGWRGTVHRMGAATIEAMRETFGTNPSDLLTAIGPSICQDCYEVSEDVIERFAAAFPAELHNTLYYRKPNGRYQLNLWEANRRILLESGVPAPRFRCQTSAPAATLPPSSPTAPPRANAATWLPFYGLRLQPQKRNSQNSIAFFGVPEIIRSRKAGHRQQPAIRFLRLRANKTGQRVRSPRGGEHAALFCPNAGVRNDADCCRHPVLRLLPAAGTHAACGGRQDAVPSAYLCFASSLLIFWVVERTFSTETS